MRVRSHGCRCSDPESPSNSLAPPMAESQIAYRGRERPLSRAETRDIPWPLNSGTTKTSIKYANTARSDTTRANATCCPSRYTPKQSEFLIDRSTTVRNRPLAQYEVRRNSWIFPISSRAGSVEISNSGPNLGFLHLTARAEPRAGDTIARDQVPRATNDRGLELVS